MAQLLILQNLPWDCTKQPRLKKCLDEIQKPHPKTYVKSQLLNKRKTHENPKKYKILRKRSSNIFTAGQSYDAHKSSNPETEQMLLMRYVVFTQEVRV